MRAFAKNVFLVGAYLTLGLLGLGHVGCSLSAIDKADKLITAGQWDQAVDAYRDLAKKHPFDRSIQEKFLETKVRAAAFHYQIGVEALRERNVLQALRELQTAIGLDPSREDYHIAFTEALKRKEAKEKYQLGQRLYSLHRLDEAMAAYERAVELDPQLVDAVKGITTVARQKKANKKITHSLRPVTLRFQKAKLREVFEVLARTVGLNVVFDKDVRDDPVTIFLKDMPYDDALNLILNTNKLSSRKIGPKTLLIIPNSKQKMDQYQDLMIRTFYLSNAKAKNVVNLLRSMLESKRVFVDEQVNALVVRDVPAKISLAERIIHSIDRREPEVLLDLEVLEVNRTKSLEYGVNFAKRAGAGVLPDASTGSVSTAPTPFTFQQLTSIGTGSYLFTFPASVLLDFFKQESDAKTLAAPKLRVLSNRTASISVGDKQPILLSTTNVLPGQAATGAIPTTSTVTSIEFKDTGVKLSVEPIVHLMDELTLKLKVEVTRLGDEVVLQASPEIKQFKFGTRTAETTLRLRDDETVILGGLIQDEKRKTRVTVPGLGDIPLIGELFTSTTTDAVETEVVLAITPHIVRNLDTPGLEGQAFWSGTETNYATEPVFSSSVGTTFPLNQEEHSGEPQESTPSDSPRPSPKPGKRPTTPLKEGLESRLLPMHNPNSPKSLTLPSVDFHESNLPLNASEYEIPQGRNRVRGSANADQTPIDPRTEVVTPPGGSPVHDSPLLVIQPHRITAAPGQELEMDLSSQNVAGLSESVITVSFDPQVLEFVRVKEESFPSPNGGGLGTMVTAKPGTGQVVLHVKRQGGVEQEPGVLTTLTFRGLKAGSSPVTIHPAFVQDGSSRRLAVTARSGTIQIR